MRTARRELALAIVDSARCGTRDRARLSENALRCLFPLGLDGGAAEQPAHFEPDEEEVEMGVCVTSTWLSPAPDAHEREERIRARARRIWEQVGRSGRPDDYRFQAEIELELDTPASEGPSAGAIARSGHVGGGQR